MSEEDIFFEFRQEEIKQYISKMPSLPTTVTKVLQICNNPATSPNDLNRVISLDPVLTGQILKLINSAYYNLPNQVTSIARAIIMIGINTVKNLVLSTAVLKNFSTRDSFQALDMDAFWTHSLCVGVTAKLLAVHIGVPIQKREEFFVAGLLHDLGKIPLNNCFSEDYARCTGEVTQKEEHHLYGAENNILGVNHCTTGEIIAEKWNLGDAIHDAITFHHEPARAKEENAPLAFAVALANVYANRLKIGSAGDKFTAEEIQTEFTGRIGINWDTLTALRDTVAGEIEKAKLFLEAAG